MGSVSIVLMIVVAIIIVASCICCFKLKTLSAKQFDKIIDDPDKYTKHLGSEEAKKEFMKKVLKAHGKSMGLGQIRTDGEEEDVTDLFIQFLLESAVKGVGSDSESKKEFIKAVKTAIGTTSNEKQDQGPNVQAKEPNVQPSLKDGEVEVGRYERVHHPGRDVSNDEVIDMSPTGTRKNTDPSRLISTSV